jgi:hypothetical protein
MAANAALNQQRWAAGDDHPDTIKRVLAGDADPVLRDNRGMTARDIDRADRLESRGRAVVRPLANRFGILSERTLLRRRRIWRAT